jgi:4-hydroxy-tetrahydrodipicolinate synthase
MKNSTTLHRDNLKDWPVITAMVTPFSETGVDDDALKFLVKQQQDQGCGVLILGSTGEAFSLTPQERSAVLELAQKMDLTVPLVVGVTDCSHERVLENIRQVNDRQVQAILISLPPYFRPGPEGQKEFFDSVLNASNHPVILYNHPGRAGVAIAAEVISALATHPNLLAVKHSAPGLDVLQEIKKKAPQVPIYLGDDSLFHAYAKEGVVGLISVMANAWPEKTKAYVKGSMAGSVKDPLDIFEGLEQTVNPIPIKMVLSHLFEIRPDVRLPLSLKDLSSIEKIEDSIHGMENWFV